MWDRKKQWFWYVASYNLDDDDDNDDDDDGDDDDNRCVGCISIHREVVMTVEHFQFIPYLTVSATLIGTTVLLSET